MVEVFFPKNTPLNFSFNRLLFMDTLLRDKTIWGGGGGANKMFAAGEKMNLVENINPGPSLTVN